MRSFRCSWSFTCTTPEEEEEEKTPPANIEKIDEGDDEEDGVGFWSMVYNWILSYWMDDEEDTP